MKQTALFFLPLLLVFCSCQENNSQKIETNGHTSLGTPVPPTATDEERNSLGYLKQHVGKRPAEVNLWQTEPLQTRLQELLGEQYGLFEVTMQEARPLQQERVLYTHRYLPRPCGAGIGGAACGSGK